MRSEMEVFDKRNRTITETWLSRKGEASGAVGSFESHVVSCAVHGLLLLAVETWEENGLEIPDFLLFLQSIWGWLLMQVADQALFMQSSLRDQVGTWCIQLFIKGLLKLHCLSPVSWFAAYQQTLDKSMSQFPGPPHKASLCQTLIFQRSIQDRL